MFKTYIDNTVFYKKQEYYAQGWITSEKDRIDSIFDIYDECVSVVLVLQDGEYYAPGTTFDKVSFIESLIDHIDYDNHVEDLGDEEDETDEWTDPTPWTYNNGGDMEDDTHG
jgi:hypothetical protein